MNSRSSNGTGDRRQLHRRSLLVGGSAAVLSSVILPALAQGRTKSGSVEIEQVQVAFIGSANVGGGTLSFQGKSYRFSVGGLGVGGYGMSKMQATGDVFDMKDISQFPGAYGQARSGITVGESGSSQLWLQNPNGVLISLRAKRTGFALSLGADAVYIDFK